jgi:hypothetical protein
VCPLYVSGGYCDFGSTDVLGGWIAGVTFLIMCDALFICCLLLVPRGRLGRLRLVRLRHREVLDYLRGSFRRPLVGPVTDSCGAGWQ